METKNTKRSMKKKVTAGTALVVAIMLLAGTFMWWSSESSIANNLKLGYIDVQPIEKFPDGEVEPGIELKKEVYASNTGTADAAVRMFFEESIQFVDYDAATSSMKVTYAPTAGEEKIGGKDALIVKYAAEAFNKIMNNGGYTAFDWDPANNATAYKKDLGEGEIHVLAVAELADGSYQIADYNNGTFRYAYYVRNGAEAGPARFGSANAIENATGVPSVYEIANFRDYVTLNFNAAATKWSASQDGYYYYTEVLGSGETTEMLLESVKFEQDLPDSWQAAKYVIDVTVQAEQGVEAAVVSAWGQAAADLISGLK